MKKNTTLFVILGIIVILFFWGCGKYNGLVTQDETVKKAWNNVEAEYQNRSDLVGNLVETVQGAADFEQSTLTAVVEARAKASSMQIDANSLTPENIASFQAAQSQLSGSLSRLLVTVEAYPNLKATENFKQLQTQLEQIENNIKNSRKKFNDAIKDYNTMVRSFPTNIIGSIAGFHPKEGFSADPGAEKKVDVDFDFKSKTDTAK